MHSQPLKSVYIYSLTSITFCEIGKAAHVNTICIIEVHKHTLVSNVSQWYDMDVFLSWSLHCLKVFPHSSYSSVFKKLKIL